MRVKATIAYDGSRFFGFQNQTSTKETVLGYFYEALKHINISTKILGSGRTDTGVHASAQVIHFDVPNHWKDASKLQTILNRFLHPNIHIRKLTFTNESFHAIYSAKRRVYRYVLCLDTFNPYAANYVSFEPNLNLDKLQKDIKLFEGEHDFEYFKKNGSHVAHYKRTIYKAHAYKHKNLVVCYFEANGFVRSQIRYMMAFLMAANRNEISQETIFEQLNKTKFTRLKLYSPSGLYLAKIKY